MEREKKGESKEFAELRKSLTALLDKIDEQKQKQKEEKSHWYGSKIKMSVTINGRKKKSTGIKILNREK